MSDAPKLDVAAWTMRAAPQQAAMVAATNDLTAAWMKRRQEAFETGIHALQQIAACQDPALAARVCADWMGGSMNRILADIGDAQRAWQAMLASQAAATVAAVGEPAGPAPAQAATEPPLRKAA